MLLTVWAEKRQKHLDTERPDPDLRKTKSAYRELELKTGLNQRTVAKAARDGLPVSYECAEKLSNATRPVPNDESSGPPACSIDEIHRPGRFAKAAPSDRRRRAAS